MKVKELVGMLSKLDQEEEIFFCDDEATYYDIAKEVDRWDSPESGNPSHYILRENGIVSG